MGAIPSDKVRAALAFRRWLVPVFALMSLALAIGLGVEMHRNRQLVRSIQIFRTEALRQERENTRARAVLDLLTAPDTLKVTLVSEVARPLPQGRAFDQLRKGLVFAANLPALPSNRTYQLWLVPVEGKPLSAGVFHADTEGNGLGTPTLVAARHHRQSLCGDGGTGGGRAAAHWAQSLDRRGLAIFSNPRTSFLHFPAIHSAPLLRTSYESEMCGWPARLGWSRDSRG